MRIYAKTPILASTFFIFSMVLSACAGAQSGTASRAPATETAGGSAPTARDPKIAALAKSALACKFEDGVFDEECAAYKAWSENEELFAEGKGNDSIFAMLGDTDEKARVLADAKGIDDAHAYFADQERATKLFDLARKSPNAGRSLGRYASHVDAETLGLGNEARALAKHPNKQFRQELAAMISRYQTPTALDVVQILLADSEREVQASAASALSTGGITPGAEPVCALLSKQLARSDEVAGVALWAGSSSRCVGMDGQVIAELGKRTSDPAKITNAFGVKYALAAEGVCSRTASADLKRKAFAVGQKLADPKVPDANTRRSAIDVVVKCDPTSAAKVLTALAKDSDKFVVEGAKKALDTLGAKKK